MRYVLVHGAWHGGWCWERVARELASRGHDVAAPDLPSDQPGLTQLDYAALIGPEPDAVVVGHSLGGLTGVSCSPALAASCATSTAGRAGPTSRPRPPGSFRTATAPRPLGRSRSSGRRRVSTSTPASCARL